MLSDLEAQLLAHIDDDVLIRWAQELTRIPSVWRPQQGQGELDWMLEAAGTFGIRPPCNRPPFG